MAGHEHATYIETVKKGDPNGNDISVKSGLVEDKAKSGKYDDSNRQGSVKIIEPGKWGSDLAMAKIDVEKDASGKWKIVDTTLSNLDTKEIAENQNMVDEYQDTNFVQYKLVELLGSNNKNVCVVGDSDQSIYAFFLICLFLFYYNSPHII